MGAELTTKFSKLNPAKLSDKVRSGEIDPLDHLDKLTKRKWSETIKEVWEHVLESAARTNFSIYTGAIVALLKVKNLDPNFLADKIKEYFIFSRGDHESNLLEVVRALAELGWDSKYEDAWENAFSGKNPDATTNIRNGYASQALQILSKVEGIPSVYVFKIINKLYSFSWNTSPIDQILMEVLSDHSAGAIDENILKKRSDSLYSSIITELQLENLTRERFLQIRRVIDAVSPLLSESNQKTLFKLVFDTVKRLKINKEDLGPDTISFTGKVVDITVNDYRNLVLHDLTFLLDQKIVTGLDAKKRLYQSLNKSRELLEELNRKVNSVQSLEEYVLFSSLLGEYTDEQIKELDVEVHFSRERNKLLSSVVSGIELSKISSHHAEIVSRILTSDESYSVKSSLLKKLLALYTEHTEEYGLMEYVVTELGDNPLLDRIFIDYALSEKFITGDEYGPLERFRIISSADIFRPETLVLILKNFLQQASEPDDYLLVASAMARHKHVSSFEEIWKELLKKNPDQVSQTLQQMAKVENLPTKFIARLFLQEIERDIIRQKSGIFGGIVSILLRARYDDNTKQAWFFIERQRLEVIRNSEADIASDSLKFTIEEPSTVERLARFYGSLTKNIFLLNRASINETFDDLVYEVLQENPVLSRDHVEIIRERVTEAINEGRHLPLLTRDFKAFPRASLGRPTTVLRDPLSKIAIIGGGPAAILYSTMSQIIAGREVHNLTMIDKSGKSGGIWGRNNVVGEGHNTFRSLDLFGVKLSNAEPRPGEDLVGFLEGLSDFDDHHIIQGDVKLVSYNERTGKYQIYMNSQDAPLSFDSVVIATGNEIPKSLNGSKMRTNYSRQEHQTVRMHRWQRQIKETEYNGYQGTSPIVIGLGNSAMAMIGEFLKMQEAGIDFNPVILTHYSDLAINNPHKVVEDKKGRTEGPIFRGFFDLSKVAGDIDRISERYLRALSLGWIKSSVQEWQILEVDQNTRSCKVLINRYGNRNELIENVHGIWALIGYQNNPETMKSFGLKVNDSTGEVQYDPVTQKAETQFIGDPGRVYVIGAAASRSGDRNREVIPGMIDSVARTLLADLLEAQGRY